jgi:hypothetical protein
VKEVQVSEYWGEVWLQADIYGKASFIDVDKVNQISAVIAEFDYAGIISGPNTAMEEAVRDIRDPAGCGVTVEGRRHDEQNKCGNLSSDLYGLSEHCAQNRLNELTVERESYKWIPSMLEFYWQSGIGKKGQKFLQTTGFIYSYEYASSLRWTGPKFANCFDSSLEHDQYHDAASPYGKVVRAFLVVEGWHIHFLLTLVGIGLVLTICVVAVATAISHELDIGLTAGSYVGCLVTALIAIFTFLSAVIWDFQTTLETLNENGGVCKQLYDQIVWYGELY